MKKILIALLVAASAVPAAAAPFTFTQTFTSSYELQTGQPTAPVIVGGTFDGDANGNLITNITNVTLSIGGVDISGPIYTARYDADNYTWHNDGQTLSFDGTANNILFINSDFPTIPTFSAYYYSIAAVGGDSFYRQDVVTGSYQYDAGASTLQITAADAVPEPAMLGLFGLGVIGLGLGRRRKAV